MSQISYDLGLLSSTWLERFPQSPNIRHDSIIKSAAVKWCCLNVHERLILAACWIYTTAMLPQRQVGKCGVGVLPGKVSLIKWQVRVFVFVCIRKKLLIISSVINLCIHYDFVKLIPIFYLLSNLLMHFICLLLIYYRKTVLGKKIL